MVAAIAAAAGIAELVGTMRCRFAYEGLFVGQPQRGQLLAFGEIMFPQSTQGCRLDCFDRPWRAM